MGKRGIFLIGPILGLLCCVSNAAPTRLIGDTVFVNETPIFAIRTGDPVARSKPLIAFLNKYSGAANARPVINESGVHIYLGSKSVFRILGEDATSSNLQINELAKTWSANLNRALAMPPLFIGKKSLSISNGKDFRISLAGKLSANATVESSDESIVKVRKEPGYMVLSGGLAGTTSVIVNAGTLISTIQITVMPLAANFPQNLSASVTGIPSSEDVVRGAIETAIWNQLKTQPSAEIRFEIPPTGTIPPGEAKSVSVRVRTQAPEAQPSEGVVNVVVRNMPTVPKVESELWYCNYPETLESAGPLFGGKIESGKTVRMLYHHVNESRKGLVFHAQAMNLSDAPATILLIPGESQVDKNPVLAGIEAGNSFLRNWLSSSGELVQIPPHSSVPISFKRLAPHETVSGLIYISLVEGGANSVLVRADAKLPFQPDFRWAQAMASDAPWRVLGCQPIRGDDGANVALSPHIYPIPFKELDVNYLVGGRHSFVRIGQQPIANTSGEMVLDGNFGVIYTIRARVENPTAVSTYIEVVFEASAGYSGALFAINGQILRTPLLQPKDERRILRMRLEPGASRLFTIQTIPLSGGSYPITLAFRPLEPNVRDVAIFRKPN